MTNNIIMIKKKNNNYNLDLYSTIYHKKCSNMLKSGMRHKSSQKGGKGPKRSKIHYLLYL